MVAYSWYKHLATGLCLTEVSIRAWLNQDLFSRAWCKSLLQDPGLRARETILRAWSKSLAEESDQRAQHMSQT